jgi:hypothetical protein
MRISVLVLGIVVLGILVAGCTQSSPSTPTPVPTTAAITSVATTAAGDGGQTSVTPGSVTVPVVTPVVIPATGTYVYVNYLGSFSGSYGTATNMMTVSDSGERLYPIDPVNGTIIAGFAKLDASSHPLEVRIYDHSQLLKTGTSSGPNGMVNISVY